MPTSFLSVEGILMISAAVFLDLLGVVCLILDIVVGIGEVFSLIPDIIGLVFFGIWLYFRSTSQAGSGQKTEGLAEKVIDRKGERKVIVEKIKTPKAPGKGIKRGAKFALTFLGELAPFIGALPFWTMFVVSELNS